jgi:hypothetical protein
MLTKSKEFKIIVETSDVEKLIEPSEIIAINVVAILLTYNVAVYGILFDNSRILK